MVWKTEKSRKQFIESEIGTIRKEWKDRITVALVYPNIYHVGMSNLGFQTVYQLLNEMDHVVCERRHDMVEKVGFFQEDNGNLSSMRLMSFIALLASIGFGLLTILLDNESGIYITFGFLLAAFAPKAVQKFAETKIK